MTAPLHRRTLLHAGITAGTLLTLNACTGLLGGEWRIFIAKDKLQERITRAFPIEKNLAGIARITLSNPQLRLDANAIGTTLDIAIPSVLGILPALNGTIDMRYRLRLEPTDNTIRMQDIRIQRIHIQDSQGRHHAHIDNALAAMGEQLLRNTVLYTLRDKDIQKMRQLRYTLQDIAIQPNGIELVLVPEQK